MNIGDQITALASPLLEKSGAFIVDVVIRGERKSKVIELFIDTDAGVTSDQCVVVSRELSQVLDEKDLITGSYQLVVSSPGLERPLKLLRQYTKNVGRKLEVQCKVNDVPGRIEGTLTAASETGIVLQTGSKDGSEEIKFEDIMEARVLPAW
jgi:ribosome maturation factor RimP